MVHALLTAPAYNGNMNHIRKHSLLNIVSLLGKEYKIVVGTVPISIICLVISHFYKMVVTIVIQPAATNSYAVCNA